MVMVLATQDCRHRGYIHEKFIDVTMVFCPVYRNFSNMQKTFIDIAIGCHRCIGSLTAFCTLFDILCFVFRRILVKTIFDRQGYVSPKV